MKKQDKSMKIAMFFDGQLPDGNGVATSIENSVKYLASKGNEVVIFCAGKTYSKTSLFGATVYTIKSKETFLAKCYLLPKFVPKKIKSIFEKYNFNIVHVHTPFSIGCTGAFLAKVNKIPVVGTYHTNFDMLFAFYVKNKILKVMKKTMDRGIKKFYDSCDAIVSPSETQTKMLLEKEYKNITTISNPVDISRYKKTKGLRLRLGIPQKAKVAAYIGRLSKEKKIDLLIKAFKLVYREDRYFIIGGKGPDSAYYKELVEKEGVKNVIFTGFIEDKELINFYNTADIFISMSDFETHGLTIIEAMACGIPCIGVHAGGVADTIEDGKNGFLVNVDDYEEFGRKMDFLFKNNSIKEKMSSCALKSSKIYSVENVMKEFENLYNTISCHKVEKTRIVKFFENIFLKDHPIPAEVKIITALTLIILGIVAFYTIESSIMANAIKIDTKLATNILKEVISSLIPQK